MRESVLQKQILDYCKRNNIYCLNIYGSGMTGKGTPDIIICLDGRFIALECKVGKNTLSDAQILHSRRILANNGVWGCPRKLSEAIQIIESVRLKDG